MRATHDDSALKLVEIEDMGGLAHGQPAIVGCVHRSADGLLSESGEVLSEESTRGLHGDPANDPRRETPAQVSRMDAHREAAFGLSLHKRCAQGLYQLAQGQVVDGGHFPRDPVVVHGVHAVGGDVHFEARAAAGGGKDAFYRNAAKGEVFGKLRIVNRQLREIAAQPFRQDVQDSSSIQAKE